MKPKNLALAIASFSAALLMTQSASATAYYWDSNGATGGTGGIYTFNRSDLSEQDTAQIVEFSDDLVHWDGYVIGASPGGSPVVITENIPSTALDTVTVTVPAVGKSKFFTRLRVTK